MAPLLGYASNPQTSRSSTSWHRSKFILSVGWSSNREQYTVAASSFPVSASLPSLHEGVERQPATVAPILVVDTRVGTPPALVNLPAEHPHGHNLLHPLGGRGIANLSSGNLSGSSKGSSIQSRASDRFSIITTSRDSVRATHGQPSRRIHRRFGNDPVDRRSASMGSTQSCASDRLSVVTTSHDPIRATHDQPSRLPANFGVAQTHRHRGSDQPGRIRPTIPHVRVPKLL
jgi:hypothetical protein